MKKTLSFLLALTVFVCAFSAFPAGAEDKDTAQPDVRDITAECEILVDYSSVEGRTLDARLTDNDETTYLKYPQGAHITVSASERIGGVYIKFDRTPPLWTLSYGEKSAVCGQNGFLHEYEKLEGQGATALEMTFTEEVSFADIFILSEGQTLPAFVQVWRPAEGPCDIMLLSCHSDDDQLFFAGSVPDAVARGAEMQVCYFTNHWNTHKRPHELLNGLWTCGLDRYPVIGPFTDTKKGMSEEEGLQIFADIGFTYEDMVKHQTELLRKYKPQIVLVHDINGEYGHSAHRLDSHSLRDAALLSPNPAVYPDLTELYGVWDVPKIYIHLYDANQIDFEIDAPLEYFGGRTAYQVSQDAFRCHISQFNSRYRDWLIGTEEKPVTKGSEFPMYSPRYYGLWKSLVGPDERKTDFYEHIVFYADQNPPQPTEPPTETPTETPAPRDPLTAEDLLSAPFSPAALIAWAAAQG